MTTKRQAAALAVSAATLGLTLAACDGGGEAPAPGSPTTDTKAVPSSTATAGATSTTSPTTSPDSNIAAEQAGQIATDKYGGDIEDIDSDSHNGESTWEVEINNSDQGEIEVEVSKSSGKIVKVDQED